MKFKLFGVEVSMCPVDNSLPKKMVKRVVTEHFEEKDHDGERRIRIETTTERFVGQNTVSTSFEYL